jgi:hypothetical protein
MKEKGVLSMTDKKILDRDRIGICTEGECRDRVRELAEELQAKMKEFDVETPEDYPEAKWSRSRNEPPGFLGGHV